MKPTPKSPHDTRRRAVAFIFGALLAPAALATTRGSKRVGGRGSSGKGGHYARPSSANSTRSKSSTKKK